MLDELKELWKFRELLLSMVQREIRIRYKNSALGFLWSFITPLATTLVMTLVFGVLLNNKVQSFSAYFLAAYLPFMFFQFSVLDSAQSVLIALPLVKKIYFPREILPLATIISNFIHLLMGFVVFFGYLLVIYIRNPRDVPFQAGTIYLPLLLIISFMMSTGVGLLVSALNTFYEDVKYVMTVFLYLLFYLCPIIYFIEQVANFRLVQQNELLFKLYNLNPLAPLCTAYRQTLLAPQPIYMSSGELAAAKPLQWGWVAYVGVFSFLIMVYGYHVFNKMKWRFVERP